jgi:soluble lytic murein transglycosylase-like protein
MRRMRVRPRVPVTALATVLFLVLAFNSTPSDPAVATANPPFSQLRDEARLHELAHWLAGRSTDLRVLRPEDLELQPQPAPRRFELFGPGPSAAARLDLLRGMPFGSAMLRVSARHRVDALLVAAVVETESGFAADAVSPQGAVGLMQLLPSTGEDFGADDLLDPYVNLDVGSRYLGTLVERFGGNLELALAAYNAGPATVERYGGMPPFPETREYVNRVMSLYQDYQSPWKPSGAPRARRTAIDRAVL